MRRDRIQIPVNFPAAEDRLGLNPARALLAKARAETEQLYATAREKGFLAGLDQLLAERSALTAARKELFAGSAPQIAELALELAAEALGQALREKPESICDRIRRAVSVLQKEGELTLHVHPEDKHWLEPLEGQLLESKQVRVVSDSGVAPGAARLVSAHGAWEADPLEHLRRLKAELLKAAGQ